MSHLKGGNAKRALLATTGDLSPQRSAERKRGSQKRGFTFIRWSNEFICKILHKANLLKIQHCQNHRQRLQKDTEKRGKFSDTQSVAKFDTPVSFKGKLPANERRTKDILLAKFLSREESDWFCLCCAFLLLFGRQKVGIETMANKLATMNKGKNYEEYKNVFVFTANFTIELSCK